MALSHAKLKIIEITCLKSSQSVCAYNFTFNLIGDYGVNSDFFVHKICITSDDHASLKEMKIIVPMFNHFDMTSNLGDDYVLNDLLYVCLFKHVVACKFDASKVYSPMLGWFNDEHCQSFEMNKSFTYMCKVSCNIFTPSTSCDNFLA